MSRAPDGGTPSGSEPPRAIEIIRRYVPILRWLPAYDHRDLAPDVAAGVTTWAVVVPVALAYGSLAGVPPEYGLVTAFAALAAYAVLGTSRHLKVAASSTMAVMSMSIVAPLAAGDASRILALSAGLALMVGVLLVAAGVLRLGFISEFLSKPVVTGFIIGVALTIIVSQLPKLLGIPAGSGTVVERIGAIGAIIPQLNLPTVALGFASLGIMLLLRSVDRRIPGPLIVGIGAIVLVGALDLETRGVAVVGEIATLRPSIGLPEVEFGDYVVLLTGAAGVVFLAVGESLSAARSFAIRHRDEIDGDQELIGLGAANLTSGLFGGFIADASLSQSAASESAGARTQLSSLVTAVLVLLTAMFLVSMFHDLPTAVLAAILIAAVVSLIDVAELRRFWAWRRTDAVLALAALIGVLATDVLVGLLIAVLLSLGLLLFRASRPYLAVLGRLPGDRAIFVDVRRNREAAAPSGMLVVRLDAPLYFFNAGVARTEILALVDRQPERPGVVIVDIGGTADLDVTTADMLGQLVGDLGARGVAIALAQARGTVRDRLSRTGLIDRIGRDRIHLSVPQAVALERERIEGDPAHAPGTSGGPDIDPSPGPDPNRPPPP